MRVKIRHAEVSVGPRVGDEVLLVDVHEIHPGEMPWNVACEIKRHIMMTIEYASVLVVIAAVSEQFLFHITRLLSDDFGFDAAVAGPTFAEAVFMLGIGEYRKLNKGDQFPSICLITE